MLLPVRQLSHHGNNMANCQKVLIFIVVDYNTLRLMKEYGLHKTPLNKILGGDVLICACTLTVFMGKESLCF
jgi:hypothetical protein